MKIKNQLPLVTILAAAMSLVGCASLGGRQIDPRVHVRGPGTQFLTLEAAVIDALAYAHLEGQRLGTSDRIRGGVITETESGFTYDEISVAPIDRPNRIEYSIGRRDVARFHAYPIGQRPSDNARNDRPTTADRRSVDRGDPLHRPLYVLTPGMTVKSYTGPGDRIETLADLRSYDSDNMLASNLE